MLELDEKNRDEIIGILSTLKLEPLAGRNIANVMDFMRNLKEIKKEVKNEKAVSK